MIRKEVVIAGIMAALVVMLGVYAFYTPAPPPKPQPDNPIAEVHTNMGNFSIELYQNLVPELTDHFIHYAMSDFYNGMVFHKICHPLHMNEEGKMVPTHGSLIMTGLYSSSIYDCLNASSSASRNEVSDCVNSSFNSPISITEYGRTDVSGINLIHKDLMVSWYKNSTFSNKKIYSQFYICNGTDLTGYGPKSPRLDESDPVFGKVIMGANVIRKMALVPTNSTLYKETGNKNLICMPYKALIIKNIKIIKNEETSITVLKQSFSEFQTEIFIPVVITAKNIQISEVIEKNINQNRHSGVR